MKLIKKVLDRFTGLHYSQEYLCIARGSFSHPLHVYLVTGRQVIKDITNQHLFTGYHPLIFVLCSPVTDTPEPPAHIEIIFSSQALKRNETITKKDALAHLSLQLIRQETAGSTSIAYYIGEKGTHRFLSLFHQSIIGFNNYLYNKRPGNVYLDGNLLKQVQIAYSVPRTISLITVSNGEMYNLFPTDLHGPVNDEYYVISLRHGGKACKQVETSGRIVISEIDSHSFRTVYSLGKNHMQELRPRQELPFSGTVSEGLKLPLPHTVLCYRELELIRSFEQSIHKQLLFRVISRQRFQDEAATLAHVHNCYATWRHNNGLAGNYLLR